jgi:hypothetical protein
MVEDQPGRSHNTSEPLDGLGHPDDRSATIRALRTLKRNSHNIDPGDIRACAWTMGNGWRAEHARHLTHTLRYNPCNNHYVAFYIFGYGLCSTLA